MMAKTEERIAVLETKVQTILYMVAAILGMKGFEWVYPPIMQLIQIFG